MNYNYKVLCIVSGVLNLVLIANFINFTKQSNKKVRELTQNNVQDVSYDSLLTEYNSMERILLDENAKLTAENNELKFLLDKKPQIIKITKDEKDDYVSHDASNYYNGILSRRYDTQ